MLYDSLNNFFESAKGTVCNSTANGKSADRGANLSIQFKIVQQSHTLVVTVSS
jgi:hypothetical protein